MLNLLQLGDRVLYKEHENTIVNDVVDYTIPYFNLNKYRTISLEYVKKIACL